MSNLEGRVALVTGAGGGIGRAVAVLLAARGARVVVVGGDERRVAETVGEIVYGGGKARHVAGDVRDPALLAAAVDKAVDVFGGLHIVVANAVAGPPAPIDGALVAATATITTSLLGAYHAFHAAAPRLGSPGRLVATTPLAPFAGPPHAAEAAAEHGIVGLVHALAQEIAPRAITCNAVLPRGLDVDAVESRVAEAVVLLCAPSAASITGQAITVAEPLHA